MFNPAQVFSSDALNTPLASWWQAIPALLSADESDYLAKLQPFARANLSEKPLIDSVARHLVEAVRADKHALHILDQLLLEYSLDTEEGVLLMCLAESLLRIPDRATADALIRDKLSSANWQSHLKRDKSILVNASTWGLMLSGKIIEFDHSLSADSRLQRLLASTSESLLRGAINQSMKVIGRQFVLGETLDQAIANGAELRMQGYCFSYDMLGEAALTMDDAERYLKSYFRAIEQVADTQQGSVSIKLSALFPRYEQAQRERVLGEMFERILPLCQKAKLLEVPLTIDAEEVDRLMLSMELFEKLYRHLSLQGWGQLGMVVQSYHKAALAVLAWLAGLAHQQGDKIPVRLVKGAYWDAELKLAQQRGQACYPLFTRKAGTDSAYLACARLLLSPHIKGLLYPQFATHNAHTIAAISAMAQHDHYEYQRLHGMGEALYRATSELIGKTVRIYGPVGSHRELLPYLVRRLLENGANSSFVHRLFDKRCPVEQLIAHPCTVLEAMSPLANPHIPLPPDIYQGYRQNSQGSNLDDSAQLSELQLAMAPYLRDDCHWQGISQLAGDESEHTYLENRLAVFSPYHVEKQVGQLGFADSGQVDEALLQAERCLPEWQQLDLSKRVSILNRFAELLEAHRPELLALCQREAGKTLQDSIDELREAVDFLHYYGSCAQRELIGYSFSDHLGLQQVARYQGRGVFVCISPWNFPLAIFVGQIAAALVAGNTVIAKPAESTSLLAVRAVELWYQAGLPRAALQLLLGAGSELGPQLCRANCVAGVAFTGSTATAKHLQRYLAEREGPPPVLIAETGGINAMIVDSSALLEQVVRDVLRSAFVSAGQRCSALRVVAVQQEVFEPFCLLLSGAMQELKMASPLEYRCDVAPVISQSAQQKLLDYIDSYHSQGKVLAQSPYSKQAELGHYVAATALLVESFTEVSEEQFGPILHVLPYERDQLGELVAQINDSGYGLTLGLHSRNISHYLALEQQLHVGNCYINRDQVGAVVGVQPFGGHGLSGTGPKAGGPLYLKRFCHCVVNPLDEEG
ncbi:bifunctional proline dehydrogenase/L-glutamate gamma-semialdehyde dehydrogenase PutA [Aliagarivorans taiwanensis]|uniref:bifunctional proline dehydrogenase/L-glutamate gamma-semialdehyde dehydrogenase PutA n=1 Tax=Aliagarivorans taiwanensis TaxID=561966 RepID=UPI000421B416|nr:bifunctional proline dehydrogenase/L-glutamate gamma-semialdehyde dehydrogenase PutA [Aliagarivorans taiwanensis]